MNSAPSDNKLNAARELAMAGNFCEAVLAFEKAIRRFPSHAALWLEYGVVAGNARQLDRADHAFAKAAALEPLDGRITLEIGRQYSRLRQPDKARIWLKKAAANAPQDISPLMELAILEEQNHRFAPAREAVESCLSIDPQDDRARCFAALLDRRENNIESAERRLRDLIASNPRQEYVRYTSRYELAEILDKTERHDEAMQWLAEAKAIVQGTANVPALLQEYEHKAGQNLRTTQMLPRDVLGLWAKAFPKRERAAMPGLAFLGGHPRSGTTLLEQILGAHPSVAAFDESRVFQDIVCKLYNAPPQPGLPRPGVISNQRLNVIRRRYVEGLQHEWPGDLAGRLIIDKNPSPTALLRLWLKVFPEVRVLIALRDPRDVVISCYFQNIPLNPFNANFLSLERTARHYAHLMDVWLAVRQWEGLNAMEIRYEDTVADMEKEGRRTTKFLGLEWDPTQSRFHEISRKKSMYSPTYHDASQPVYVRSVSRWRAYEKFLSPILPILEPYCRALGYS